MSDPSDSRAVLRPVACLDDGSLLLEDLAVDDLAVDDLAVEAGVLDGASCPVLHLTRELCFTIFSSSSVHGGSLIFVIPVNICVGRPREDGMSLLTSVCVVVNMSVVLCCFQLCGFRTKRQKQLFIRFVCSIIVSEISYFPFLGKKYNV